MSKPQASKTGIVIPQKAEGHRKFLSWLIAGMARVLMATWRFEWDDRSGAFNGQQGPLVVCLWHNRLAISMAMYNRWGKTKRPANGLAALISASQDGGLLAEVLGKFGVQPVRGSSSRRGRQALLEATTWIEKGYHVAITPDGPRGPRYKIQEGVVGLSQLTGVPILPVSAKITGKICTKSWDKFQIPLPFAHCKVVFGPPISVPREATDEERNKIREELERAMMAITED